VSGELGAPVDLFPKKKIFMLSEKEMACTAEDVRR
jgi:hypothetical protein